MSREDRPTSDGVRPSNAVAARLKRVTVKSWPSATIGRSTVSRMLMRCALIEAALAASSGAPRTSPGLPSLAFDRDFIGLSLPNGVQSAAPLQHDVSH